MSGNFVRFHKILNQRDAKNFSFVSGQTKNFDPEKNMSQAKSLNRIVLLAANRWPYRVLTFLIHGLGLKEDSLTTFFSNECTNLIDGLDER